MNNDGDHERRLHPDAFAEKLSDAERESARRAELDEMAKAIRERQGIKNEAVLMQAACRRACMAWIMDRAHNAKEITTDALAEFLLAQGYVVEDLEVTVEGNDVSLRCESVRKFVAPGSFAAGLTSPLSNVVLVSPELALERAGVPSVLGQAIESHEVPMLMFDGHPMTTVIDPGAVHKAVLEQAERDMAHVILGVDPAERSTNHPLSEGYDANRLTPTTRAHYRGRYREALDGTTKERSRALKQKKERRHKRKQRRK